MTLPDLHLAEDALAAYADHMLSPSADERAARHLNVCAECREAIDAEREAKALLGATPDPELPAGLLAKLLEVPMTADIGTTDRTLAFDGEKLGWAAPAHGTPRVMERRMSRPAPAARGPLRPGGASRPGTRPAARSSRARRTRRGLAVSLAGLAFGVIASAASTSGAGAAATRGPGEVPGSSNTRLVVGTSVPMDVSRPFTFRRPAGATLTPAAPSTAAR